MTGARGQYLSALGIRRWRQRAPRADAGQPPATDSSAGAAARPGPAPRPEVPTATHAGVERLGWEELAERVPACTACELHRSRHNTVFGTGDVRADWLFVGEAPGAEEDRTGEPFVGRAGQLLTAMLAALDLERGQVYIANVLKCRPPENRDPMGDEVACCEPYLHRQVTLIEPRMIIALGRFAAQSLLKSSEPISRLRGRVHRYGPYDCPLVVTYHPAYLLRNPAEKRKTWADLCLARENLG
ncbi:MAG: uracil-DNA glycosylase [Gammaproteobacteria bacterium]|jgi:DNA polymerase|nr:uracil-DNA glycosylase [Gammaproteobacteria bacterium]